MSTAESELGPVDGGWSLGKQWQYGRRPGTQQRWWRPPMPPAPVEVLELATSTWVLGVERRSMVVDCNGTTWNLVPTVAAADPHLTGPIVRLRRVDEQEHFKPTHEPTLDDMAALIAWVRLAYSSQDLPALDAAAWRALNSRHGLARRVRERMGTDALLLAMTPEVELPSRGQGRVPWLLVPWAGLEGESLDERWAILARWADSEAAGWSEVRRVIPPVDMLDACVDGTLSDAELQVLVRLLQALYDAEEGTELVPMEVAAVVELLEAHGVEHGLQPQPCQVDKDARAARLCWTSAGPTWMHPPLAGLKSHALASLSTASEGADAVAAPLLAALDQERAIRAAARAEREVQEQAEREERARQAAVRAELEKKAKEAAALAAADARAREDAEAQAAAEEAAAEAAAAEVRAREKAQAHAASEAAALAEAATRLQVELDDKERLEALARAEAEAAAEEEARQEALARAEAEAVAEEQARLKAIARAEAEAVAEERARLEAIARAEAEAVAEAKAQEQARLEAERIAEAEARAQVAARARADQRTQALAEEQMRADALRRSELQARERADEERGRRGARQTGRQASVVSSAAPRAMSMEALSPNKVQREVGAPSERSRALALRWGMLAIAALLLAGLVWSLGTQENASGVVEPAAAPAKPSIPSELVLKKREVQSDEAEAQKSQPKASINQAEAEKNQLKAPINEAEAEEDRSEAKKDEQDKPSPAKEQPREPKAPLREVPAPTKPLKHELEKSGIARSFGSLRAVSLWRGETLLRSEGLEASCNRYGDLVLHKGSQRKIVVCGLFHLEPGRPRGSMRRRTCVQGPPRCVSVLDVSASLLPAYLCTPKSGFAYGLVTVADLRKRFYISEEALIGDLQGRQTREEWAEWCGGRPAPYVYALSQLKP